MVERAAVGDVGERDSADLVGRDALLTEVVALLSDPTVRLVTLTGPGGVGKTTLARTAARLAAGTFPDGVALVELAAERDPERLPLAVVQTLGLEPAPGERPLATLARGLDGRRLLVLDNLEQLVGGVGIFDELLAFRPGLTLLATSRTRLNLASEHELVVPTLTVPVAAARSLDEIAASPAVQLLARRARRVNAAFTLAPGNAAAVAEVCRRLDGLPLALELGAARLGLFSAEALLARLDARLELLSGGPRDAPSRHRSMRDAIGWSVELLGSAERRLFALFSVFAGGCTQDDLAAVAGSLAEDGGPAFDVRSAVEALRAGSLLHETVDANGDPRLAMLESIRDVATERLSESGDAERARRAHAAHYRAVAEREGPRLRSETYTQLRVWNRLEADITNFRAAAAWFLERGDAAEGLRLVTGLDWFWSDGAYLREGVEWLDRLLALTGDPSALPPGLWATAHRVLTMLHGRLGQDDQAARTAEEAIRALAGTDDPAMLAETLGLAAGAALARDDLVAARNYTERCLALTEAIGQVWDIAYMQTRLAVILTYQGETAAAAAHAAVAVAGYREAGDIGNLPRPMLALATASLLGGDLDAAAEHLLAAIEAALPAAGTGQGEGWYLRDIFTAVAVLAHRLGAAEPAVRLLGAADAEARRTAPPSDRLFQPHVDQALAELRSALGEPRVAAEWAAGSALSQPEQIALAESSLRDQLTPPLTGKLAALSPREREVLRLVMAGCSNREIGDALFISAQTASKHVSHVLSKLGLVSRTAAAAYAAAHGLRPAPGSARFTHANTSFSG